MKRFFAYFLVIILAISLCACKPIGDYGFPEPERQTEAPLESETQPETENDPEPMPSTPEVMTREYLDSIIWGDFVSPKNVILIIGDGMGVNDITIAEQYADGLYDFGLIMTKIPHNGLVTTGAANNAITDSAAAATALSAGIKTNVGMIGKASDGTDVELVGEIAKKNGMKVGIVTDDALYGATPTAFVAHNVNRNAYAELSNSLLDFAPDVMIGASYDGFINTLTDDGKAIFEDVYSIAQTLDDFDSVSAEAASSGKLFAGFNQGSTTGVSDHLAKSTRTALALLENENGFFLMIEGCGTDVFGHANTMIGKKSGVVNLDKTVEEVLRFMKTNPDTLLIITSDHETGGVRLPEEGKTPDNSLFTTTTHTPSEVKVFALGLGSDYFSEKTIDNTDIGNYIKQLLSRDDNEAE